MIYYLIRLINAAVWFLLCLTVDILCFILFFHIIHGFEVDNRKPFFMIRIDTFGEQGIWKSYFHWALKIKKHD